MTEDNVKFGFKMSNVKNREEILSKWGLRFIKIRNKIDKKEREIEELKIQLQETIDASKEECYPCLNFAYAVIDEEED